MTNYIIMPGNVPEHYFFKPYEGICMRKRTPRGTWQEHTQVFGGAKDGFGLYCAKDKSVHIVCTDHDNKLIYILSSSEGWKKYVISKLNKDIFVSDMRLYSVRGRLNLLYSALYNGENLLVHCILGDHAKPSAVDVIETPHFSVSDGKAYYTNSKGIFGYVNLSDEKPSVFNPVYEDAHCGTRYMLDGKEHILFTRNSSVFLDGREILNDARLEMPVLVRSHNKTYIMWRCGSFIRYTVSSSGEEFSAPQRFMSTGKSMNIYSVQKGEDFFDYYGYHNGHELVLLGNPEVFERSSEYTAKKEEELLRVKNLLNETQKEVVAAKKEIARLGKVISALGRNK